MFVFNIRPHCNFRYSKKPSKALGYFIPLAMLWPLVTIQDAEVQKKYICKFKCSEFQNKCMILIVEAIENILAEKSIQLPSVISQYPQNMTAWENIIQDFSYPDCMFVIVLHSTTLIGCEIKELFINALSFCYKHKMCVFSICTTFLQCLLLKNKQKSNVQALMHFWKNNFKTVDETLQTENDMYYDFKKRGRGCPERLSYNSWDAFITTFASKVLESI